MSAIEATTDVQIVDLHLTRMSGPGRFPPFGLTFPRRVPNGDLRPFVDIRACSYVCPLPGQIPEFLADYGKVPLEKVSSHAVHSEGVDLHPKLTMLLHIRIGPAWYGSEQRCQTVRPL